MLVPCRPPWGLVALCSNLYSMLQRTRRTPRLSDWSNPFTVGHLEHYVQGKRRIGVPAGARDGLTHKCAPARWS